MYTENNSGKSDQEGPEKQGRTDQRPSSRHDDHRHGYGPGSMPRGKGVGISFSVEGAPFPGGSAPAKGKLEGRCYQNRKNIAYEDGDGYALPRKIRPPPKGKQTGNDYSGIGGMGNYRKGRTAAGTRSKLLEPVASTAVETLEGSKTHALDYTRSSSFGATNIFSTRAALRRTIQRLEIIGLDWRSLGVRKKS